MSAAPPIALTAAESTAVVVHSRAVLARHARSFRWASAFLPAAARDDAAVLYAFCRLVDDLADEAPSPVVARADLDRVRRELEGEAPARPVVAAMRELSERAAVDLGAAHALLDGVISDLDPVRVADDRELLRYCYRVAGTVGLMMCGVLGVRDPAAVPFAIDLGVAMQLTNICRDVKEDAGRGRIYLPTERLRAAGVDPDAILAGSPDRAALADVVRDLLALADQYYASAMQGLRYIPARPRAAILVAARVYRRIGVDLRAAGADAWAGRTVVPTGAKLAETLGAGLRFLSPAILGLAAARAHDPSLHRHLAGLPGAHASLRSP